MELMHLQLASIRHFVFAQVVCPVGYAQIPDPVVVILAELGESPDRLLTFIFNHGS